MTLLAGCQRPHVIHEQSPLLAFSCRTLGSEPAEQVLGHDVNPHGVLNSHGQVATGQLDRAEPGAPGV